jgi:hypothetical protein
MSVVETGFGISRRCWAWRGGAFLLESLEFGGALLGRISHQKLSEKEGGVVFSDGYMIGVASKDLFLAEIGQGLISDSSSVVESQRIAVGGLGKLTCPGFEVRQFEIDRLQFFL